MFPVGLLGVITFASLDADASGITQERAQLLNFNISCYLNSYLYVKKSTNPMSLGSYNSQGYIGESTSSSGCIDTPDNSYNTGSVSYNTGSVSFTIYVYITDLTLTQYLYCKNIFNGAAVRRGVCVGLLPGNQVFVEVNTNPSLSNDNVETLTGSLTYTIGWNLIG